MCFYIILDLMYVKLYKYFKTIKVLALKKRYIFKNTSKRGCLFDLGIILSAKRIVDAILSGWHISQRDPKVRCLRSPRY